MAMTIRLTPEQQARFAARAEREGLSLSRLMILDCEAATARIDKSRFQLRRSGSASARCQRSFHDLGG
jgi:hypothetical protein